jgi:hypothetical protein
MTWLFFLLLITFFLNLVTGIIKFPELQRYFLGIYNYISSGNLSRIHDVSGLLLIGLIIVHLIIKRKRLWKALRVSRTVVLVIGGVILIAVMGLLGVKYFNRSKVMNLGAVEIRDYQGEKLGSINDFLENSIKGPQNVDMKSYALVIDGLVNKTLALNYDSVLNRTKYTKVVTLNCVEGWSVKILWEGVLVKDLINEAGVKTGANTVIFYAYDGYTTSLPLDFVLKNNIIIASKMNGVVLPASRGFPFQLVAENKWGYKWIKWITKIELSNDTSYQGYWETRGYNDNGDLNGSKFAQ